MVDIINIYNMLKDAGYNIVLEGDKTVCINSFCSLNNPKDFAITWVKKPMNDSLVKFGGNAQNVIVANSIIENNIEKSGFIICDNPREIFFVILEYYFGSISQCRISDSAMVLSEKIGKNVAVGNFCHIGEDVIIGDNVVIGHNVTIINKVIIGDNCIIHSGVVIGTDGFGFYIDDEKIPHKITHFGGVKIGKNVEIGANTCIDRGTIDDTIIGDNTKIDNLVHIAHNDIIGSNTMVVAGTVMGGSVVIGDDCYLGLNSSVRDGMRIAEGAYVGMDGSVTTNIEAEAALIVHNTKPLKSGSAKFLRMMG